MHQHALIVGVLVHPRLHQIRIALIAALGQLGRRAGADGALSLGEIHPLLEFSFGFRFLLAVESVLVLLAGFGKGHCRFRLDAAFTDPQQEDLRYLRHFLLQQFEAVFLEGLQDHLAFALADAEFAFRQFRTGRAQPAAVLQLLFEVMLDPGEQLWLLGFDVQARLVFRVGLGDIDDFVQGQDFQPGVGRARAIRVSLVVPAAGVEGFQFGHGEGIGRAVLAVRKLGRDVGGALQVVVVQGEQHAVLAALQIHFQVVGAEVAGQFVGGGGGFRCIEGRATVSDHGWMRDAMGGGKRVNVSLGGMGLAETEQQAQHEGAFGESGGHVRVPFAGHFQRRTF
ncbi:hypothetical protein EMIT0215P_290003 [Pseudomonas serboccidentalis]